MAFKQIKLPEETYSLRPIGSCARDAWAGRYAQWSNDPEVTAFLYQGTVPTSVEKCKLLYDTLTNENNVVYDIRTLKTGHWNPVGIVGIFDIYWPSKVGEFRILIGDTNHWGQGLGRACLEVMNEIAFETLGLHKFWLGVNANHHRAVGAYSKSGFKKECILERHHYKNGVYNDLMRMRMFREDYEEWKNLKQG